MSHLEGMEWAVFETQLGIVDENLRPLANLNDNPELTLARKELELFVLNINVVLEKKECMARFLDQILWSAGVTLSWDNSLILKSLGERFPKHVCKQKITSLMMLRKYEFCVLTTFLGSNQMGD